MANATADIPVADPETRVRAPLFAEQLAGLDQPARQVVVDLGPARAGTLAALEGFRCRLDILDLPELLGRDRSSSGPGELIKAIAQRLPPQKDERAGLVFCWTLLNYLNPKQIQGLMALLDRRLTPTVRVHALIESSATRMPARPALVCAEGREQILIDADETQCLPAPRYASGLLEKSMPGFKAERTMLLGNGMREYLFYRSR